MIDKEGEKLILIDKKNYRFLTTLIFIKAQASNTSNSCPHSCITRVHFHFPFPFQLAFPLSFQLSSKHMSRHKQYLSTFMHYVHQSRSIPMTYASFMSPLVIWHMHLMNIRTNVDIKLCTRLCYDTYLRWM